MNRVHLLCNAHLDPVWLWEWEEGAAEALSTFRTAADFCEAYEGFVFNHNEALLYQWVEEYEPELVRPDSAACGGGTLAHHGRLVPPARLQHAIGRGPRQADPGRPSLLR